MKYKVGDRVRVQSLDWYNENKNKYGNIPMGHFSFNSCNKHLCGTILTIERVLGDYYLVKENDACWTDEMIEGLAEDLLDKEIQEHQKICDEALTIKGIEPTEEVWHCPEGYQFVDENGNVINAQKIALEKKKKEYPKTYEECCKSLDWNHRDYDRVGYESELLCKFQVLLLCRDAYWKIAGDEMGLGKPWKPDWENSEERRYSIVNIEGDINLPETTLTKWILTVTNKILVFPTIEMRDAFYENFKELIESGKEFL